jgi:hypothetical protein
VSETYDRKFQGALVEYEVPVGGMKMISLVFTPEKDKRYLGELIIKCRYLHPRERDGVYSCKVKMTQTNGFILDCCYYPCSSVARCYVVLILFFNLVLHFRFRWLEPEEELLPGEPKS